MYFTKFFFFLIYNTDKGEYCINQNSFQEDEHHLVKKFLGGTSQAVQWLRLLHLAMQRVWV